MSFDLDEHQVLRLAMAANGPVNPLPEGSSVTLEQLQEIRWNQHLTESERKERLEQVRRILRALARMKSQGMFSVSEFIHGTDVDKCTAHTGVDKASSNDKGSVQ